MGAGAFGSGFGFAIAAPIGPMGLRCIRRTLGGGRVSGMATGLGVSTVHTVNLLGFSRFRGQAKYSLHNRCAGESLLAYEYGNTSSRRFVGSCGTAAPAPSATPPRRTPVAV